MDASSEMNTSHHTAATQPSKFRSTKDRIIQQQQSDKKLLGGDDDIDWMEFDAYGGKDSMVAVTRADSLGKQTLE